MAIFVASKSQNNYHHNLFLISMWWAKNTTETIVELIRELTPLTSSLVSVMPEDQTQRHNHKKEFVVSPTEYINGGRNFTTRKNYKYSQ